MVDENQINNEMEEKPSIFGMIMNPVVQFERIKQNPKIWAALIVMTVLTMLGTFMSTYGIDYANEPEFIGMNEEELKFVTWVAQITFVVIGFFTPAVAILISSIIYLAVAKIAQYDHVRFKQLCSMNTYIYLITVLGVLVNGLAMLMVGNEGDSEVLFTSVNSIIGASGALGAFLNTVEVFTIWNLIISALGLQIVANFSKGLSWGIVIAIYVIMTGFSTAMAGLATVTGIY